MLGRTVSPCQGQGCTRPLQGPACDYYSFHARRPAAFQYSGQVGLMVLLAAIHALVHCVSQVCAYVCAPETACLSRDMNSMFSLFSWSLASCLHSSASCCSDVLFANYLPQLTNETHTAYFPAPRTPCWQPNVLGVKCSTECVCTRCPFQKPVNKDHVATKARPPAVQVLLKKSAAK